MVAKECIKMAARYVSSKNLILERLEMTENWQVTCNRTMVNYKWLNSQKRISELFSLHLVDGKYPWEVN